jgi:peptide deformylase
MIFPIVAYGAAVLRKVSQDITPDYPGLKTLIEDMWETMYASSGVGLAAPQINKDIRLFVMDSAQIFENLEEDEKGVYPDAPGIKQVFINAHVVSLDGEEWAYNEGCLSIPKYAKMCCGQKVLRWNLWMKISNRTHKHSMALPHA